MKFAVHTRIINLKLKREFGTAHLRRKTQRTVLVRVTQRDDDSHAGFGECIEHPAWGTTCEHLIQEISHAAEWMESLEFSSVVEASHWLTDQADRLSSHARSALDQALWDLHGRIKSVSTSSSLMEICPLVSRGTARSSITIGLDTPGAMAADLENHLAWPIIKIKLGGGSDIEALQLIRTRARAKVLRVDANEGWDTDNFLELLRACEAARVELIEQPFERHELESTRLLRHATIIPVIADESCCGLEDVDSCSGIFDGINIKLYKCGGLLTAARMIARARELKLKVMLGCMVESVVGVSAMAQLAPYADFLDLDGATLIANNPTTGMELNAGLISFPQQPGNGFDQQPLQKLFDNH
jgi:L-alanine-DL-glutamate epimerase-like enolase superfamily enzyme